MSYEQIPGWFDWQATYREWIREVPKNGKLVEVGVYLGRSLAFLASEAIAQGRHDVTIIGVDPWVTEAWMLRDHGDTFAKYSATNDMHEVVRGIMREHAPAELERVMLVRAKSVDAWGSIRKHGGLDLVDRVYIDGDHTEAAVRADIAAWLPLVKPGGVIAGHDFGNFGVEPAVRAAFGDDFEVRGATWLHRVRP
jgi:hypothetical protein